MADTVTSTIIQDGHRNVIVRLTGLSDGTGETAVVKVNILDLDPMPDRLAVESIVYDLSGMQATLLWEGTPNKTIATISSGQGDMCFEDIGGLSYSGPGQTGNILLTTISAGSNDTYTIVLNLRKKF